MKTVLTDPVSYSLDIESGQQPTVLDLSSMLGRTLHLRHTGRIFCVSCGRKTGKSFNQGYCYPCFTSLAQCDMCIMKPETCHHAAGTCREPEWAERFCFQPHIVYLANSSGIKVGITRQNQIPTRWIDQGAIQALPVFTVSSRHVSGLVEVALAEHVSDKTSWQQMLKNQVEPIDLKVRRDELLALCQPALDAIRQRCGAQALAFMADAEVVTLNYPVQHYPAKVKSFNLDKDAAIAGVLQGIKGQYLLFDTGVINIRKYAGYEVEWLSA